MPSLNNIAFTVLLVANVVLAGNCLPGNGRSATIQYAVHVHTTDSLGNDHVGTYWSPNIRIEDFQAIDIAQHMRVWSDNRFQAIYRRKKVVVTNVEVLNDGESVKRETIDEMIHVVCRNVRLRQTLSREFIVD
ncbi:hypothetical protein K461DRAFT_297613 [Myriangium duriaei CBS 260.36]|uniref:Uncharacterized protein n=1 Tax=Myriangium duriaei CBS 260.36 TaxID=1168546 RepID=A0A9P4IWT8_9PEZI|nr:hypothetical protein K461DRAFT_297613 [Myriangium duriaei CBS 260.36]